MKTGKCDLYQTDVTYLVLNTGNGGVHMDGKRTAALKEWPVPKFLFDIRSFVELTNFY